VARQHGAPQRREAGPDLLEAPQAVEPSTAVAVAVGGDEDRRLDLPEAVEHPGDAEIG
jgi:hypothetical protein